MAIVNNLIAEVSKVTQHTAIKTQNVTHVLLQVVISRGALGYFLGGYVPPGTPNWHPVLKKISPKIDTPF